MKTAARTHLRTTPDELFDEASVEQLSLLPTTSTPARFRLSKDTRERGLRHVAEIRQMLAARTDHSDVSIQPRHDRAA